MKSKIVKLATAAVIIIVTLVVVLYIVKPTNITSPTLADVVQEIYKARTVTYKQTFYLSESQEFTNIVTMIESGMKRSESPHGDILITDFSSGKNLHLMPNSQRAILTQHAGRLKGRKLFNYLDYLDWISRINEEGGEFIGRAEVKGKKTNVFFVKMPLEITTVWVDPDTNLPVRVEVIIWPNPDKDIMVPKIALSTQNFGRKEDGEVRSITTGSSRDNSDEIQNERIVLSDFVWNAELDESLFSLEPPEGYTVE